MCLLLSSDCNKNIIIIIILLFNKHLKM